MHTSKKVNLPINLTINRNWLWVHISPYFINSEPTKKQKLVVLIVKSKKFKEESVCNGTNLHTLGQVYIGKG